MKINVITQAAIKINSGDRVIYFDPYKVEGEKADYIFITHDHYDHYDEHVIKHLLKEDTRVIIPKILEDKVNYLNNYLVVEPNNSYTIDNINFITVPSYNTNKSFHPKDKDYVGYIVELENKKLYIMGDTDRTLEVDNVKCDICFVPIGGTYTMNVDEAVSYINDLKPEVAIPIHYGSIVGDKSLGTVFKNKVDNNIKVELYI